MVFATGNNCKSSCRNLLRGFRKSHFGEKHAFVVFVVAVVVVVIAAAIDTATFVVEVVDTSSISTPTTEIFNFLQPLDSFQIALYSNRFYEISFVQKP